ncbi:MAG: hypothetical protein AB1568_04630 [Thermodesulfobacteriota bacterium]
MSITGVCQTCGSVAPLEWFLAEGQYKQCIEMMAKLPRDVAPVTVRYLSLFRPESGRAISPAKALRLLGEIADLVGKGWVQGKGRPARPCPPTMWAEAMEQMLANPTLRRPMKGHKYLAEVASDVAEKADAQVERKRIEAERGAGRQPDWRIDMDRREMDGEIAEMDLAQMAPELRAICERVGKSLAKGE